MRKFFGRALLCAAVLAAALTLPRPAIAQVFSNAEIERGLRPGVYIPYDGATVTQRYNYYPGAFLYFNGNARQLNYLDYLDRLDRAERFGYRPPLDPFGPPRVIYYGQPPCSAAPPGYHGR